MAKFFKTAFAAAGDKTSIPEATQPDGSVSYNQGFGFDYQRDLSSDPLAKAMPRDQTNELFYEITLALQVLQTHGYPDWITSSDNGGSPYSYDINAYVRYSDGNIYQSLINANTSTPGTDPTKWALFLNAPAFKTSDVVETFDSTLPDGWLWLDGKTIGSAASGATARANADTQNLFTSLWNSIPAAALPIYTSAGTPTTRGISAAADFAANKRLSIPDKRGRVAAGADNMGGTNANRLTNATAQGVDGAILGAGGGEQAHTPTLSEMVNHTHVLANKDVQGSYIAAGDYLVAFETALGSGVAYFLAGTNQTPNVGKVLEAGGGNPFNVVQPTIIALFRIKL